jgi:hypothetical protein
MKPAGARFDVLSPAFYFRNIVSADGPLSLRWIAASVASLPAGRAGSWAMLIGLAAASVVALRSAMRRSLTDAERSLLATAAIQLVLFVSLLSVKTMSYMIALWPLGALAIGWTLGKVWDRSTSMLRTLLVVVMAAVCADGGFAIVRSEAAARRVMPYTFFTDQIARCIPPGARVLGLQHYWMGLRQFEYRTWLLPINMSRPGWYDEPLTLREALDRVDPDVLLIDRYIEAYLRETEAPTHRFHQDSVDVDSFIADRGLQLACVVRDVTYGEMLIYR